MTYLTLLAKNEPMITLAEMSKINGFGRYWWNTRLLTDPKAPKPKRFTHNGRKNAVTHLYLKSEIEAYAEKMANQPKPTLTHHAKPDQQAIIKAFLGPMRLTEAQRAERAKQPASAKPDPYRKTVRITGVY